MNSIKFERKVSKMNLKEYMKPEMDIEEFALTDIISMSVDNIYEDADIDGGEYRF